MATVNKRPLCIREEEHERPVTRAATATRSPHRHARVTRAKRLGRGPSQFSVDHQLVLGGRLHWTFGRPLALENAMHVVRAGLSSNCCAATGEDQRRQKWINRVAARRPNRRSAWKADIGAPTPCARSRHRNEYRFQTEGQFRVDYTFSLARKASTLAFHNGPPASIRKCPFAPTGPV